MKRFNSADITLIISALFFIAALVISLSFPESHAAKGFLFVAEAALVGGAADWFAVKALFEKPLGFSWHTAILPSRRKEFANAVEAMMQREFFSRKNMMRMVNKYDWEENAKSFLMDDALKNRFKEAARKTADDALASADIHRIASKAAAYIQKPVKAIALRDALSYLVRWMREDGRDKKMLRDASEFLRAQVTSDSAHYALIDRFSEYRQQKLGNAGGVMNFLAAFAAAANVINLDDLANAVQTGTARAAEDVGRENSPLQERIRAVFYRCINDAAENQELQQAFENLKEILQINVEALIKDVPVLLNPPEKMTDAPENDRIGRIIGEESERIINLIAKDEELAAVLEKMLQRAKIVCASAAKEASGEIARAALEKMTDEELNKIVYEKIEPDLIRIRKNGSIVGALIGLTIFLIMTATSAL